MHKRLFLCTLLSLSAALLLWSCDGNEGDGSSASQTESHEASSTAGISEGEPLDTPEISISESDGSANGSEPVDVSSAESKIEETTPESDEIKSDDEFVRIESSDGEDDGVPNESSDASESKPDSSIPYEDYVGELFPSNEDDSAVVNGPRPRD